MEGEGSEKTWTKADTVVLVITVAFIGFIAIVFRGAVLSVLARHL